MSDISSLYLFYFSLCGQINNKSEYRPTVSYRIIIILKIQTRVLFLKSMWLYGAYCKRITCYKLGPMNRKHVYLINPYYDDIISFLSLKKHVFPLVVGRWYRLNVSLSFVGGKLKSVMVTTQKTRHHAILFSIHQSKSICFNKCNLRNFKANGWVYGTLIHFSVHIQIRPINNIWCYVLSIVMWLHSLDVMVSQITSLAIVY